MKPSAPHPLQNTLLALFTLGAIHLSAPWPGVQAVLNTFLVLALAPEFRSPLVGGAWAALAGWVLEGTLRAYPHLGGTPLANLTLALLATGALAQWPPAQLKPFLGRLAGLAVLHALLIHLAVRIACGPHAWGWGGLLSLLSVPLWGGLAYKLHRPLHRR